MPTRHCNARFALSVVVGRFLGVGAVLFCRFDASDTRQALQNNDQHATSDRWPHDANAGGTPHCLKPPFVAPRPRPPADTDWSGLSLVDAATKAPYRCDARYGRNRQGRQIRRTRSCQPGRRRRSTWSGARLRSVADT